MLVIVDALLINTAFFVALCLRFDGSTAWQVMASYNQLSLLLTAVMLPLLYFYKLYHRAWAYASVQELLAIIYAISLGSLITTFLTYMLQIQQPRSIIVLHWAFTIIFIGGSRFAYRLFPGHGVKRVDAVPQKRTLIFGAGDAGALVVREYITHYNSSQPVVGFIDDDPKKQKLIIHGVPVLGTRADLPRIVDKYKIEEIIIAMPSVPGTVIKEILDTCKVHVANIKILPGVYQLLSGEVTLNKIRPVDIEDLLGREPVKVNLVEISQYLKGKVVLVTGAGGSIGSELCRQIAVVGPSKLVILGHGENSIHKTWMELLDTFYGLDIAVEIADVRDRDKLEQVFAKHRPNVVFHAAAHKHVPLMEAHPDEAIKTNVLGTKNVAELADKVNSDIFVLISTDKAVNPSSVMGATKRLAELIVQNMFTGSQTKFVAVRFGNVLGSRGSVVPIFKEQIAKGGPVTVTHPEMKRYFMTIPEAVQLVIQAGAMAQGGEIFVLDMGEPIKIVDLARNLIKLSGFEPDKDIKIEYTGIRPGEKLFEELLTAEEGSTSTKHKRIYVARPVAVNKQALVEEILHLREEPSCSREKIFECLGRIMPQFDTYREVAGGKM